MEKCHSGHCDFAVFSGFFTEEVSGSVALAVNAVFCESNREQRELTCSPLGTEKTSTSMHTDPHHSTVCGESGIMAHVGHL